MANIYLGGTDLSSAELYIGGTAATAAYLGGTEVWAPSGIPAITTDGLINYIDFNRGSYTAGSSTLTDLSGNSKDADLVGTDTVATDSYGYGDVWAGGTSGNKLQYTEGSTPLWGEFTISWWGTFESFTNANFTRIFSITNQSRADWASFYNGNNYFGFHGWGSGVGNWNTGFTSAIIPQQTIKMFTYTNRRVPLDTINPNVVIWVNDTPVISVVASNTGDSYVDAYGYALGNRYGTLNQTTNQIRVYNYAFYNKSLSQAEVETNYNAQKADFGL